MLLISAKYICGNYQQIPIGRAVFLIWILKYGMRLEAHHKEDKCDTVYSDIVHSLPHIMYNVYGMRYTYLLTF